MLGLLVGHRQGTHIGGALLRAAEQIPSQFVFQDYDLAYNGLKLVRQFSYHFLDKRPVGINVFNDKVESVCRAQKPDFLLATGLAPLTSQTLNKIGSLGVTRVNYLTDDPWNPAHKSKWFMDAIPQYDIIFSTRRANIKDLEMQKCSRVEYLPFGYDEKLFFKEQPTFDQKNQYGSDIIFVGGADNDRLPYVAPLIKEGYKVSLYGGYWERYRETRPYAKGIGDPQTIRLATACSKVALCLVRKANRDDNCMRSFEIPAVGACLLAEDTTGHRDLFGEEGECVLYFKTTLDLTEKARYLLSHSEERARLAESAHARITNAQHTYKDRLNTILNTVNEARE